MLISNSQGKGRTDEVDFQKRIDHHVGVLVKAGLSELLNRDHITQDVEYQDADNSSTLNQARKTSHQLENVQESFGFEDLDPALQPSPVAMKNSLFSDLSFLDESRFTPGCMVCQV